MPRDDRMARRMARLWVPVGPLSVGPTVNPGSQGQAYPIVPAGRSGGALTHRHLLSAILHLTRSGLIETDVRDKRSKVPISEGGPTVERYEQLRHVGPIGLSVTDKSAENMAEVVSMADVRRYVSGTMKSGIRR